MRILSIKLKNFGVYKDQEIKFDKKNITSIVGENSVGKTTLVNSIKWCLFNIITNSSRTDRNKEENVSYYLNKISQKSLEDITISCEITFEKNGENYPVVKRTANFIHNNKEYILKSNTFEITKIDETKGTIKLTGADAKSYMMTDILSYDVSNLNIIDGESMKNIFGDSKNEIINIKQFIKSYSKINRLEDLKSSLKEYRGEIIKKIKTTTEEKKRIEELTENLKAFNSTKEEVEQTLQEDQKKRTNLEQELKKIRKILSESDEQNIKTKEDMRSEIKASLQKLNTQKEEKEIKKIVGRMDILFNEFFLKSRNHYLDLLEEIKNSENMPPKISHQLLKDLIKKNKCICERKCDEEIKSLFDNMLKSDDYSSVQDLIHTLILLIESNNKQLAQLKDRDNDYTKDIDNINMELSDKNTRLNSIDEFLKNYEHQDIKEITKKRENIESEITELDRNIGASLDRINVFEKSINNSNSALIKLLKNSEGNKKINTLLERVESYSKKIDAIVKDIYQECRENLNLEINKIFKNKLFNKDNNYYKISINEDFSIIVTDSHDSIELISEGTKLTVGYSLTCALNILTKNKFPLIIDSPNGKLDGTNSNNLIRTLIELFPKSQVIFLFTDNEFKVIDTENTKLDKKPNFKIKKKAEHISEVIVE